MGNLFASRSMEENFKKNQDFITEMNKIKMERHIQMHNQIRERETAMKIAHDRELVLWLGSFYAVAVPGLLMSWRRTGRAISLSPIIPLSFLLAYQIDQGYGNKVHRVRLEAENILQYETELIDLPCGLPTPSTIDQARLDVEEKKKLHPSVPAL